MNNIKVTRLHFWDNEDLQNQLNQITGDIVSMERHRNPWSLSPSCATKGVMDVWHKQV